MAWNPSATPVDGWVFSFHDRALRLERRGRRRCRMIAKMHSDFILPATCCRSLERALRSCPVESGQRLLGGRRLPAQPGTFLAEGDAAHRSGCARTAVFQWEYQL